MIGIRWTAATAAWAGFVAITAWVIIDNVRGNSVWSLLLSILGWTLVVVALSSLITVRGATARQWFLRWWRARREVLRSSWIVDSKGRAMVWDGRSARMFIEVFGKQWALSRVESTGESSTPPLPLSDLRDVLRQYDIKLAHIRIVQYGYKVATEDRASTSVLSVMGTLPHQLGGRTFIEVSVSLLDNLNAVDSRQTDRGTVADGVTRTISIAASRVLRVLHTRNITARVVPPSTVLGIHADVFSGVGRAAANSGWSHLGSSGDATVGAVVSFVPTQWSEKSQLMWNEVHALRQYTCLSLRPDGNGDTISYATSYLTDDPDALALLPSQGLRRENGRHMARVSNLLPVARDLRVDDDGGRHLNPKEDAGVVLPSHPLGVYLGLNEKRDRTFMFVGRGGEPMWFIGAEDYAKRVTLRLSTQRHRIRVAVDGWQRFVSTRNSRLLQMATDPLAEYSTCDVLVVTPEQALALPRDEDGPAVIVVASDFPPIDPHNAIIPIGGNQLQVVVGKDEEVILVEEPSTERTWMV